MFLMVTNTNEQDDQDEQDEQGTNSYLHQVMIQSYFKEIQLCT